jgi:hypothetical protein
MITRTQEAGFALGVQTEFLFATVERDIDTVLAGLGARAQALIIHPDVLSREKLAALAIREKMPAIYSTRNFPQAGGLTSYGSEFLETQRQAGIYVGRILKGEKPGELPVQQATKFDFVINLKTAKALGSRSIGRERFDRAGRDREDREKVARGADVLVARGGSRRKGTRRPGAVRPMGAAGFLEDRAPVGRSATSMWPSICAACSISTTFASSHSMLGGSCISSRGCLRRDSPSSSSPSTSSNSGKAGNRCHQRCAISNNRC